MTSRPPLNDEERSRGAGAAQRIFDSYGQVQKIISPTSDTTTFYYDALGRQTDVYNAENLAALLKSSGPQVNLSRR